MSVETAEVLTQTLLGTFTAPAVNFTASGSQTLSNFLASAAVTWNATGDLWKNSAMSCPTCTTNPAPYSTLIEVFGSGMFVNGQTYHLQHDDGAIWNVNGSAFISSGGPTTPITTSAVWTGGTGNYAYEIDYVATNGNPEVLQADVPASVPEASSILILAFMGAVLGLGRKLRRL
jgi:hypothetical protein